MESNLLAAILTRANYDILKSKIDPERDLSPLGAAIFQHVADYYRRDADATAVDRALLVSLVNNGIVSPKHREQFSSIILGLPPPSGNAIHVWLQQRRAAAINRLQLALTQPTETAAIKLAITEYLTYDTAEDETANYDVITTIGLEDILEKTAAEHKMPILPKALNDKLGGGAFRGHHVLVFARPEVGKSAFALNLLRAPARAGRKCLYIGNEDPLKEGIIPRSISAFCGEPFSASESERLLKIANSCGLSNVTFVAAFPGSVAEVGELVVDYKPEFVVIDQVGNFNAKDDSYTLQLGKVMRGIRTITKKSGCVTVSLHQAGDSASNKLDLDLGDVSWSNTDMAAQADLMIGIGCNKYYESQNLRRLTVVKNKITGWHGYVDVEIDPVLSRFRSLETKDRTSTE